MPCKGFLPRAGSAGNHHQPAGEALRLFQAAEVPVGAQEDFLGQVLSLGRLARRVAADCPHQPGISVVQLAVG